MIAKNAIHNFTNDNRILIQDVDYMYLLPHPSLRNIISNYTITFPSEGMMSHNYAVVPHGSATLVFSCNDSHITGNLFGPITRSVYVGKDATVSYYYSS